MTAPLIGLHSQAPILKWFFVLGLSLCGSRCFPQSADKYLVQIAARISRTEWRALLSDALYIAAVIYGFIQTFVHTRDAPAKVLRLTGSG